MFGLLITNTIAWVLKLQIVISIVLEAGKSNSKCQHSVSGDGPLTDSERAVFSLYTHMAEAAKELTQALFLRALITFMRVLPS